MSLAVESLLMPVFELNGVDLYDLEIVKEGKDKILRIYIDKEGGVDLNDCERVSRAVEAVLDEHDPIDGTYRLQVGSPGVERKLSKPKHYSDYIGHKILIKTFAPISPVSGRKKITGKLLAFKDGLITVCDAEKETIEIELNKVSSCRLVVFGD